LRLASARGERAHEVPEAMRSLAAQLIGMRDRAVVRHKARAQRQQKAGLAREREESRELLLLPDSGWIMTRRVPAHVGGGHGGIR
jgi:hypothetical protein